MEVIQFLFSQKGFWALIFQLILLVVFYFVPNFPKDIWAVLEALYIFVTGVIVTKSTVSAAREIKASRENKS
jgi:hypothetical protein